MIRVVAHSEFTADKLDAALALYAELVAETRREAGCLEYQVCRDLEQPTVLAVIEAWESEQALAAHANSAHFKRLVAQIGALRLTSNIRKYQVEL